MKTCISPLLSSPIRPLQPVSLLKTDSQAGDRKTGPRENTNINVAEFLHRNS